MSRATCPVRKKRVKHSSNDIKESSGHGGKHLQSQNSWKQRQKNHKFQVILSYMMRGREGRKEGEQEYEQITWAQPLGTGQDSKQPP